MKLKNTTSVPDKLLTQIVRWVCETLRVPKRLVKEARFAKCRRGRGFSGRAYGATRRISIRIGDANKFPRSAGRSGPNLKEQFADQLECLVGVTAHEIYHLAAKHVDQYKQRTRRGRMGSSERITRREEFRVLNLFRDARDSLLKNWLTEPVAPSSQVNCHPPCDEPE